MMQLTYDPQVDAAYVAFEKVLPGAAARTVEAGNGIVLDFGKNGRLIGVEILGASKVLSKKALSEAIRK